MAEELEARGDAAPGEPADVPPHDDGDEPEGAPAHYSTGRLTGAQAEAVNRWRARLQLDKPVPGARRKADMLRLIGIDNRPAASCSDAIAAAVVELLTQQPPDELDLARYADRIRQAARRAAQAGPDADDRNLPRYPPVSFYLPAKWAAVFDDLRDRAYRRVIRIHVELEAEAERQLPDAGRAERLRWVRRELHARDIPQPHTIPAGAIARMAIDRWARRGADRVAAAAVAYAAEHHRQPHRARRDMHRLRR